MHPSVDKMASVYLTPSAYILPLQKKNKNNTFCHQSLGLIRAQNYRSDEGRRSEIVDENLAVLRKRIKEVKNKERHLAGWNYLNDPRLDKTIKNNFRTKMEKELAEVVRIVGVVAATFGLTLFSCSCCLCIVALLVRLY